MINLPPLERVEQEGSRQYVTPAGTFPSVTTVLRHTSRSKAALEAWKRRLGRYAEIESTIATTRGTLTHEWAERALLGEKQPDVLPWSASGYIRCLLEWIHDYVAQARAVELPVWHTAGYAGSLDCIAHLQGSGDNLYLLDWKTAAKRRQEWLLEDYRLQLGAYAAAFEQRTGYLLDGAWLVIARRSGPPDTDFLDREALEQASCDYFIRLQEYRSHGT